MSNINAFLSVFDYRRDLSFQTVCDGFVELIPKMINGQNQTDETECHHWDCNNLYTHCDYIWNCPNGKDEINCPSLRLSNCSLNSHLCVSPKTNQFICLPIEKANDGRIDCLGAYDEPQICLMNALTSNDRTNFYCRNQTNRSCIVSETLLCDNKNDCQYGDDEQFCTTNQTLPPLDPDSFCSSIHVKGKSDVEEFLCNR
jgi:hypothetical protein